MRSSLRSLGRGAPWVALVGLLGGAAHALPPDGALLVAEATAGTVIDVTAGGHLAATARFATGLSTPMGLCLGPNSEIYAAEFSAGAVKTITNGGNVAAETPFATGLSSPVGLACREDRIFVVEYDFGDGTGRVVDITAGGDFAAAAGHAEHLTSALGLAFDGQGRLLVSTRAGAIFDVTAGGDQQGATPLATFPAAQFGGIGPSRVTSPDQGGIWQHTGGGDLSQSTAFALLPDASGVLETPTGIFAVSESSGEVYDITAGGDFTDAEPHADGLLTDMAGGFTAMMFYLVCGNGQTGPGEACDDGGESASCNADCTLAVCGDGQINASADEACDDGEESASCNADCTLASCGDGILNVLAGEECDDGGESASCNADCTLASCGDGILNVLADEACDDGGESASCNADCTPAACGDRVVNDAAGEQCDDGATSWSCDSDCTVPECGDGTTNRPVGEECDDEGESAACDADCSEAWCGDGQINALAGEQCDDGNRIDRDGCSSGCVPDEPWGEGGSSGQGGAAPSDPDGVTELEGGCDCRAVAGSRSAPRSALALFVVVAAAARRRPSPRITPAGRARRARAVARALGAAGTLAVGSLVAAPAHADVVSPAPTDCPAGSRGSTCHGGPHCDPVGCTGPSDCDDGYDCVERELCIGQVDCTGGWTPPDAAPILADTVEGSCTGGTSCSAGSCETVRVCVSEQGSGDSETTLVEQGCGCRAAGRSVGLASSAGALLGLLGLGLWRRRCRDGHARR